MRTANELQRTWSCGYLRPVPRPGNGDPIYLRFAAHSWPLIMHARSAVNTKSTIFGEMIS